MSNGGETKGSANNVIYGVVFLSLFFVILSYWFPKTSIILFTLLVVGGVVGDKRKAGRIVIVSIALLILCVRMVPALIGDWEDAEKAEKFAVAKKAIEEQEKKRIAGLLETARKDADDPEKAAAVVSVFEDLEGKVPLSPDDYKLLVKALLNKARGEQERGLLKLAIANVLKAKKHSPDEKDVLSLEAEIREKYSNRLVDQIQTLVKAEHWDEAMEDYNTLKQISPRTASGKEIKRLISILEKNVKAEEERKRKARINDLLDEGNAEFRAKDYDNARNTLEKVLDLDPKNPVAKKKLAGMDRLVFIKKINDEEDTISFTVFGSTAVWKKKEECECVDILGLFEEAQKIFKTLRNVITIKIIGTGKYMDKFANEKTTTTLKWTLRRGPTLKMNLDNIAYKSNLPGAYIFKMFRPWIPKQCCYTSD